MRLQSHPNQFYFVPLINLIDCSILSGFRMMLEKKANDTTQSLNFLLSFDT